MRWQRVSRESASQIPSERSEKVTLTIYHDKTMTITAQKIDQSIRVAAYCRVSTERVFRRDHSELTLIANVTS